MEERTGRGGGSIYCYLGALEGVYPWQGARPGPEIWARLASGLSCGTALGLWRTPTPTLSLTLTSLSPLLSPLNPPPFSLGTVPYTRGGHDGV